MPSWNLLCLAALLGVSVALPQVVDPSTSIASPSTVTTPVVTATPSTVEPITSTVVPVTSTVVPVSSATSATPVSSAVTTLPASSTITVSVPSSVPTPVPSFKIHPNGNNAKCLDVRGAVLANGTPVQIFDCNGTPAQQWVIGLGEGPVVLAGTNFCLDAGSAPANGVGMKIWECFSNLAAQDWFYTTDQRIALTGKGFCLDLTNGSLTNSNQVQTWKCTDNDVNQVWTISN